MANETIRQTLERVYDETQAYYRVLNGKSPVAAVMLVVSGLEDELEALIRRRIFRNAEIPKALNTKLFGPGLSPFGTFESKADVVQALGCYGQTTRNQLSAIQTVRNRFAHAGRIIDFHHEKIWPKCEGLGLGKMSKGGRKPSKKSLQNKFTDLVLDLTQKLEIHRTYAPELGDHKPPVMP